MASQNDVIHIIASDSYVKDGRQLTYDMRTWGSAGIKQWTGSDGGPVKVNYIHVGVDFPFGGTITGSLPDHIYQVQVGKDKIVKIFTVDREALSVSPNAEITASVKTKRGVASGHETTAGGGAG